MCPAPTDLHEMSRARCRRAEATVDDDPLGAGEVSTASRPSSGPDLVGRRGAVTGIAAMARATSARRGRSGRSARFRRSRPLRERDPGCGDVRSQQTAGGARPHSPARRGRWGGRCGANDRPEKRAVDGRPRRSRPVRERSGLAATLRVRCTHGDRSSGSGSRVSRWTHSQMVSVLILSSRIIRGTPGAPGVRWRRNASISARFGNRVEVPAVASSRTVY